MGFVKAQKTFKKVHITDGGRPVEVLKRRKYIVWKKDVSHIK